MRSLWVAGIAGVVGLVLFDISEVSIGCGRLPVRVRGVVVDARTGAPIEGASLLTLFHPETAREPAELERWRRMASAWEGQTQEDLVKLASVVGAARTDAAGAFEIIVGIGFSETTDRLGITWHRERGSPFHVAHALLVEKEDCAPLVHETKGARWEERQEGEIVGTLDVGTIRLEPARNR